MNMPIESIECPKCGAEEVDNLNISYPKSYECKKCGCVFVKSPQSLIDE